MISSNWASHILFAFEKGLSFIDYAPWLCSIGIGIANIRIGLFRGFLGRENGQICGQVTLQ